jgi:DNA-binding MarR family transcriptional regulator
VTEQWQADGVEGAERGRVAAHELSWALRAVVRASADVDHDLAQRLDVRPLDYAALTHVMTSEEPLGPAELSARLGISTGSGTELVDRLERTGHLRRARHPTDRRRVGLHATDEAVARVLSALRPLFDDLDDLAEGFSDAEQDAIIRYLRGANERLNRYRRKP